MLLCFGFFLITRLLFKCHHCNHNCDNDSISKHVSNQHCARVSWHLCLFDGLTNRNTHTHSLKQHSHYQPELVEYPGVQQFGPPMAQGVKYTAMKVNKWSIKLPQIRGLQSSQPSAIMSFGLLMWERFSQESGGVEAGERRQTSWVLSLL